METTITKKNILEAIQALPDDASIEDAMERLYFLAKVELGLRQAERNEGIPHREIELRLLE